MGDQLFPKLRIGMAFSAAIATAVLVGACGGGIPGDAVAVVGSAPITKAAFAHWEVVANDASQASTGAAAPPIPVPPDYTNCIKTLKKTGNTATETAAQLKALCAEQYQSLVSEVINFTAQALWIEGEAKDRGVKVTPAQITKSYDQQRSSSKPPLKTQAQLNTFLAKSGQTKADLIWRTRLNLLATGIQLQVTKQASKVSSKQIAQYYQKHHSQFVIPETLDLHLIETKTLATADQVKTLLESGQTYATLAPKDSIDPTSKAAGGKMTGVRPGQLTAQLNAAVFKATAGTLTGPIKTPFGYYVFTVDSVVPGKTQTLKEATATIKATISATAESTANAQLQSDFTKKWAAITKCATGYIVASTCSNAPKTGSTGSSGAAG
ncbi:MAG TPA: peptidyl-prolyl cis-trans isomerase [Solirubrobacteraceae bacterium]|jgi:foldase protein PrsA